MFFDRQNVLVGHLLASEKNQLPFLDQVRTLLAHCTHSPTYLAFEGIFSFVTLIRHLSEARLTPGFLFGTGKIHTPPQRAILSQVFQPVGCSTEYVGWTQRQVLGGNRSSTLQWIATHLSSSPIALTSRI